ncbi:MAG: type II toxin-antitoxin system VapC family toxin [Planctomycetes bacterium]|nr:type II toxin-antitoxin system VapC family toxin [Planctomycetota bacterium]
MPNRVYFDSCCFIDLLQDVKRRAPAVADLCQKAAVNDLVIVTSALTIAEVCKLPETGKQPNDQTKKILEFFENPYIVIRSLDRMIAERANLISRDHGIKPSDAVHVATAILTGCDVLYTYDSGKGKRKGLLSHNGESWLQPMRIEQPPDPSMGTIFENS